MKITRDGTEYFVDPVWTGNRGLLENRSEPYFSTCLTIGEKGSLAKKPGRKITDFCIHEAAVIKLESKSAIVDIQSTYRFESADAVRNQFRKQQKNQLLESEKSDLLSRLEKLSQKDEMIFENAEYTIVSDDKDKNEIKVRYQTIVKEPYHGSDGERVFKYYYTMGRAQEIITFDHKDIRADSFISLPICYEAEIRTSKFFAWHQKETRRKTILNNDYFSFLNIKKVTPKRIVLKAEYVPKMYGEIKPEDLKKLQTDYRKMSDSNFGVGAIITDFWRFFLRNLYLAYFIAVLVGLALGLAE